MICENNHKKDLNKIQSSPSSPSTSSSSSSPSLLSQCKIRTNSDDEYNNLIQKQKDEVQRILNNSDKTSVNENSFDPSKSSPPNDFMRKLQSRFHKYSQNC